MNQQKRKQVLKDLPWIYRHSNLFVGVSTIIGVSIVLSPLIYSLFHTEEEVNSLKHSMGHMKVYNPHMEKMKADAMKMK